MLPKKRWMVSTLIAMMVSSSVAVAQMSSLSESELEDVSAQGIQNIYNGGTTNSQLNNNEALELRGESQKGAQGMEVVNSSSSAINANQNVASLVNGSGELTQKNCQIAKNGKNAVQTTTNKRTVNGQVNDNGAVNLSDQAQMEASASVMVNAAKSGINEGQNILTVDKSKNLVLRQKNSQQASNTNALVQHISSEDTVLRQSNNNAAIQLNGDAQSKASALSIDNSASSAKNTGQNILYATDTENPKLWQENVQNAEHAKTMLEQTVSNGENTRDQKNNSASVQANDNAQNEASGLAITNTAYSAENIGQNIMEAKDVTGNIKISQKNTQNAYNGGGKYEYQSVITAKKAVNAKNNNAAVQVNGAQNDISGMAFTNTANSALNIGQNIASIENAGNLNFIDQSNDQHAINKYNAPQKVVNGSAENGQNNNGAVQINDAQKNLSSLASHNNADSAVNSGVNVLDVSGKPTKGSVLTQTNTQVAENCGTHNQDVVNNGNIEKQANNNGKVQLIDAQVGTSSLILGNTAGSAVNYGLNIANIQTSTNWSITQTAVQTATNF
ncbi:MAG: hypothetical protein GXO31_08290 [Epsilonproteobacteria bacterium]|nr:hypothetical protein [Campylobacterota bacterium]